MATNQLWARGQVARPIAKDCRTVVWLCKQGPDLIFRGLHFGREIGAAHIAG